jgi:hypothetical protein
MLVVVVTVGCGGDEASSSRQELPGRPQSVATFVGDGLLPGEQRTPGPAAATTTSTRPIGRPLNPVPANRTPVTRPPLQFMEVVTTTTSTSPAAVTMTTAPITPG